MLVTLATAKQHLRLDGSDEDAMVALYLSAAEDQAAQFLGRNVYPDAPSAAIALLGGDLTALPLNASVEAAILLITGSLYAMREDAVIGASVQSLPMGAHALLFPYRVGLGI